MAKPVVKKKPGTSSVLDEMRRRIQGGSQSRKKIFHVRQDNKRRVRFITEIDRAVQVRMHDRYPEFTTPCPKIFGRECPFCGEQEVRTRDMFAWTVYDYEQKERLVFFYAATSASPVPHLMEYYDSYGSILDRDYTIARKGTGFDTAYSVVPMDRSKFRVENVKPFTEKEILQMVWDANSTVKLDEYPVASDDEEEDEEVEDEVEEDEEEMEDEEEDEDEDTEDEDEEDEDEEEEEPPRKSKVKAKAKTARRR